MLNARKIVIMADASVGDSPLDSRNLSPVKFRRGDDLVIEATFLQSGIVADMSAAQRAVLEILDVGSMNSPDPRSVSLLMRKQVEEFGSPICDSDGKLSEGAENQSAHATFEFSNLETQISSGEKWLSIRVEFEDGEKLTFASGWIFVDENFLSDPELLPIENPQYIKRDEASLLFLDKSANLSDLDSKPLSRENLDVYSKSETVALISGELEFLPAYTESLESIKSETIAAKSAALEASESAGQALLEMNALEEDMQALKTDVEAAKAAAEQAAEDAQEISDPDGLLQKHAAELSALQAGKVGVGEHFLNKGRLVFSDLANKLTFPFTVMLTYEVAEWPSGVRVIFGAQSVTGFSVSKGSNGGMYISLQLRSGATCAFYVDSQLPAGKHALCVNFYIDEFAGKARCDVYLDGILQVKRGTNDSATAPFEFSQTLPDFVINSDTSTFNQTSNSNGYSVEMTVSRVFIFNFDAAAEDAPYTVADYVEGNPVPLTLRNGGGELLELADTRSAYQIKDLSGNGNHATIFGEVLSRKNEDPTTMQVEYTWGSDVSTGAYIMGDTVTLPANSEIEVLAKSSASATLSLGTSSSATTTFANAASVGTTTTSIAKFYTGDAAQKLFATPSVAGLTINLTLKITSLK